MADSQEKGFNALPLKFKVLLVALCPILVIVICTVTIILYAGSLVDEGTYIPAETPPSYITAVPVTLKEKADTVNTLLNTAQTDCQTQIEGNESIDLCNMTSTLSDAQAELFRHAADGIESAMAQFSLSKNLEYGKAADLFPKLSAPNVDFEQTEDSKFIFTAEIDNSFIADDYAVTDKAKEEFLSVLSIDSETVTPVSCTAVYTVDPITNRLTDIVYTRIYRLEFTVTFTGELASMGTAEIAFDAVFTGTYGIKMAGIHIEQEQIILHKSGYEALNKTLNISADATLDDYSLTFTSSDESIATIDENGQVEAVALSEKPITITATLKYLGKTYTDTCEVLVITEPERVEMKSKAQTLNVGKSVQLEAYVLPEEATIKTLIWYSPDESIAVVDENGVVTAISPGKVQIIAVSEIGTYMAGCTITVEGGDQ